MAVQVVMQDSINFFKYVCPELVPSVEQLNKYGYEISLTFYSVKFTKGNTTTLASLPVGVPTLMKGMATSNQKQIAVASLTVKMTELLQKENPHGVSSDEHKTMYVEATMTTTGVEPKEMTPPEPSGNVSPSLPTASKKPKKVSSKTEVVAETKTPEVETVSSAHSIAANPALSIERIKQNRVNTLQTLKSAQGIGSPVKGTSPNSVYRLIANSNTAKVAARFLGKKLSVRVEGELSKELADRLLGMGFSAGAKYYSIHMDVVDIKAPVILISLLMQMNVEFTEVCFLESEFLYAISN